MRQGKLRFGALSLALILVAGILAGCTGKKTVEFQPEDYQSLWESTVYMASKTLLKEDFASPEEISGDAALNYILGQMTADGSVKPYEESEGTATFWRIPQETIFQQTQRYFGSQLEESLTQSSYYQPEEGIFQMVAGKSYSGNYPYGGYEAGKNDLYIALSQLEDNGDGTITAVLEDYNRLQYTDKAGEKVQKIHRLVLRPGEENGWQIVSKTSELVNQPEIQTQGFTPMEGIGSLTPQDLQSGGVVLVQWGEDLFLWRQDYNANPIQTTCILLSPDGTVKQETSFTFEDPNKMLFDTTVCGENMAFYYQDGTVILRDKEFREVKVLDQLSQIAGEELHFESMALSPDGKTLAFINDTGLYTVDLATGEKTLRGTHPRLSTGPSPGQAGDMYKGIFFLDDTRLMARRVTYEAGAGYGYFDLVNDTTQLIDIPIGYNTSDYFDRDGFTVVRYQDGGLPTQINRYRFASQSFSSFEIPNTGTMPDPVAMGEMAYYFGQRDGDMVLIALNMATGQTKETGIQVSGANVRIAAITQEYRVLFSYWAPAGEGIGFTQPHLGMETAGI